MAHTTHVILLLWWHLSLRILGRAQGRLRHLRLLRHTHVIAILLVRLWWDSCSRIAAHISSLSPLRRCLWLLRHIIAAAVLLVLLRCARVAAILLVRLRSLSSVHNLLTLLLLNVLILLTIVLLVWIAALVTSIVVLAILLVEL